GVDLHGNDGEAFFSVAEPRVIPKADTPNTVSVEIGDAQALTADDYRIVPTFNATAAFTGYEIFNTTTGGKVATVQTVPGVEAQWPADGDDPATLGGLVFKFDATAVPVQGNSWL